MAKGQETHSAATRPAAGIEAQRPPTIHKTVYLERTANDTIDYRADRKIRRARERRRKWRARKRNRTQLDRSDNDINVVSSVRLDVGEPIGGGVETLGTVHRVREGDTEGGKFGRVAVSVAGTEGVGVGRKGFGAGSMQSPLIEKSKTDEREKRKGIRKVRIPVMGTTVGTEPPPPSSGKRKRNEAFEIVITKSVPIHVQDGGVGISGAQVHGNGSGSRKANRHPLKSAGACDEGLNSQDDTPKGSISRGRGGAGAREQRELRMRSIVGSDRFEEGPRKSKKNARPIKEGALYDDTTSVTTLNCTLPQHTRNVLVHHTTNRKPVEHCLDAVGLVPETAMETPAKSLRKGSRSTIRKTGDISSYFASSEVQKMQKVINEKDKGKKKRAPAGTSVISWPPLTAKTFGLIQEELENDAVSFTLYFT